jgi:ribosomal protein S18 acetylase RimI-like enzyme
VSREAIERAHRGSAAWVVARWPDGTMAGTARAIGDGATIAAVVDVTVTPDARDRGVERALLDLLLDHPRVRDCVEIRTGFDAPRPRAVA